MSWSIPIGAVKGTVVRIHVTFLLFLVWIGFTHYVQGGTAAAVQGVAFISLLFLCVLLHEFGHVAAARRYGVFTPDITLLPIGGVAQLERIPEQPSQELVIALAGPAVNLVIAAVLWAGLGGGSVLQVMQPQEAHAGLLGRLLVANLFLAVFNLVPAFPMDGGRVLRALLAYRMGYVRATTIAATVGQGVAILFGLAGLFGNPMLLFIALFVYLGASSEAQAVQARQTTRGLSATDAMMTQFETLSPLSRVEDAVECLLRTSQRDFPVVDGAGKLRGVLTREGIIAALRANGPGSAVLDAMRADVPTIAQGARLEDALHVLQSSGAPALGVTDPAGKLVGLVTAENVGELMMVLAATPGGRPGRQPPGTRRPASPWG